MSTIIALLPHQEAVNEAIDNISAEANHAIRWTLLRPDAEPITFRPVVNVGLSADTVAGVGGPAGWVQETTPAPIQSLRDVGLQDDEAEFYARGLRDGAVVLIIELPEERLTETRRLLEQSQATRIHAMR